MFLKQNFRSLLNYIVTWLFEWFFHLRAMFTIWKVFLNLNKAVRVFLSLNFGGLVKSVPLLKVFLVYNKTWVVISLKSRLVLLLFFPLFYLRDSFLFLLKFLFNEVLKFLTIPVLWSVQTVVFIHWAWDWRKHSGLSLVIIIVALVVFAQSTQVALFVLL